MNMYFKKFLRAMAMVGSLLWACEALAVPEIPAPALQDIAMASWYVGPLPQFGFPMYNGPVIYYNPNVVAQSGPALTAFFYAHEYCHISLNHIQQSMFISNPYNHAWISQNLELQADACATNTLLAQGNIVSVRMAAQLFYNQGAMQADPNHPPGQVRYANILSVAQSMGVNL